jgi:hypothetical protein
MLVIWTGGIRMTRILPIRLDVGAPVIRYAQLLCRRFATALAVVAALALAVNGALGSNHHMSAAAGHHDHGESHSHGGHAHGHSHAADHDHGDVDMAALDQDGALPSSPDADADGYLNACFAAVVLPCPSAQALPILFCGTVIAAHPRQAKGVEPDGPRKPPRTMTLL